MKKNIKFKFEYLLYAIFNFISKILPLFLLQFLGKFSGVLFIIFSKRKKIIYKNLGLIFPSLKFFEKLKILIKCSAHFGKVAFEYLKYSSDEKLIDKKVKIIGIDNIKKALEEKKGAFIVSAHFGNWEIAALALSKIGFAQGMVHRPLDNHLLEKKLSLKRTKYGNWLIPKRGALKKILKDLRQGKLIDLLIDQKATAEQSFKVKFLGQKTNVISSLSKIAKFEKTPVIFLFSYPEGLGYKVLLREPIYYKGESEKELTQKYADILTEEIIKYPHLWLLHHNRFKDS